MIRNSKLAGPRRSASQWINWHKKDIPTAHLLRSMRDIGKLVYLNQQTGKNAPMRLRSDFRTSVTIMNRLHRVNTKGSIRLLLPNLHGGSGMKTGGAHNFLNIVVARSFTADGSLLHSTECVKGALHNVTFFLVFIRTHNDVSHDIGSSVCARHLIHVSCACVFDLSSTLSSHSSSVSHVFHFILLKLRLLSFPLPRGSVRSKIPCALRPMRSLALWPINAPLTEDRHEYRTTHVRGMTSTPQCAM